MGSSRRIAILGGGISGLAAAWRLARCGKELKVSLIIDSTIYCLMHGFI